MRPYKYLVIALISLHLAGCGNKAADEAYRNGELLWGQGKYKEALAEYEKVVVEGDHGHLAAEALFQIGNIQYLNLREYKKASDTYRRMVDAHPSNPFAPDAQRKVTEIYREKLLDLNGAIAEYEKLIKISPQEADKAMADIAECRILLKDFDGARKEYRRILDGFPEIENKDHLKYMNANSYFLEGNTMDARKYFEEFIKEYPDSKYTPDARFGIALSLEEEGALPEALAALQELRGKYPNDRILELRIKGVEERIEARKKPAPPEKPKPVKKKK